MPGCGVHGNDKDARSRRNLPDTGYGLHAAEFGHGNIQQDEIGPERLREPDACEPVPRLARDRQAGLDADELFQAAAEQGVIFDYQYRWARRFSVCGRFASGMRRCRNATAFLSIMQCRKKEKEAQPL